MTEVFIENIKSNTSTTIQNSIIPEIDVSSTFDIKVDNTTKLTVDTDGLKVDSISELTEDNNINIKNNLDVDGFTKLGGSTGIKVKYITGTTPTVDTPLYVATGLTDFTKIINYSIHVHATTDSGMLVKPTSALTSDDYETNHKYFSIIRANTSDNNYPYIYIYMASGTGSSVVSRPFYATITYIE